jgi:phosphoglucosamine mutase
MNMTDHMKYFGTDGIRGIVGELPITADFILKLGWAVGMMLQSRKEAKALIGKDTRISGYMIESALEAGLSSAGINVNLIGPMPTPAIAYLTRTLRADIGIVISASHNPFEDNGIKFFTPEGWKISTDMEREIEAWLDKPIKTTNASMLGKAKRFDDAPGRYVEYCKSSLPHNTNLNNLKIVIDCANGATYNIAPHVFSELGSDIILINAAPNGLNINYDCGSTQPQELKRHVLQEHADLGIAFDGDGDRVIMVDHLGEILDGDDILYIIAKSLLSSKHLSGGVIGTYMSNLGLELALNELGIHFFRVSIGDQHIIEKLKEKKWLLGGEPSGHIIYLNLSPAADGIITALQVLLAMKFSNNMSLHDIKRGMTKFPQCIINIPHNNIKIDLNRTEIVECIESTKIILGKKSRVLVRFSGTQPLIRIMAEGMDQKKVEMATHSLAKKISEFLLVQA